MAQRECSSNEKKMEQYVDRTRRRIDEKKKRRIIDIMMLLVHVIIDIKVT